MVAAMTAAPVARVFAATEESRGDGPGSAVRGRRGLAWPDDGEDFETYDFAREDLFDPS